jgi:Mg2+ and Co2+ transporter CorA
MSSEKYIKKIKTLEKSISQALEEMLSIKKMLPGSYNKVYCRCGKRNCWCYGEAEGKSKDKDKDKDKDKAGHPFRRITWMEKGVSKTKAIPEKDVDWIKEVTENYRKFRKKRKEIQKLEENIRRLLEDYRTHIVKKTRRLKEYL